MFLYYLGIVSPGYGRGSKTLGFATANLPHFHNNLTENNITNGVYFGWTKIENDSTPYYCITNIGYSPTFSGQENRQRIAETHVLNRPIELGDFYSRTMKLILVGFLRPEQKFNNMTDLINQIKLDVSQAQKCLDLLSHHNNKDLDWVYNELEKPMLPSTTSLSLDGESSSGMSKFMMFPIDEKAATTTLL